MALGGVLPDVPVVNGLVIVVASGLIWVGSSWLEESAERLSAYYGLPAVVQGSIVVAIGSSFPELSSVVFTALAGTFNMGIGAIVGSAIFNILVIPALSGIATDGDLDTNRTIVYKEAQFYMIAVATLIITFALAVIYVPVPDGPELTGQLTRPLALLPSSSTGCISSSSGKMSATTRPKTHQLGFPSATSGEHSLSAYSSSSWPSNSWSVASNRSARRSVSPSSSPVSPSSRRRRAFRTRS